MTRVGSQRHSIKKIRINNECAYCTIPLVLTASDLIRNRDYIAVAFSSRKCVPGREVDGIGSRLFVLVMLNPWGSVV